MSRVLDAAGLTPFCNSGATPMSTSDVTRNDGLPPKQYAGRRLVAGCLGVFAFVSACGSRASEAIGTEVAFPHTCVGEKATPTPLDAECEAAVCYFALRLDATTLEFKGYSVTEGSGAPVSAARALEIASDAAHGFVSEDYGQAREAAGPIAGLYSVVAPAIDFGWFALVGAESGAVVAAGQIVYDGHGEFWLPTEWQAPSAIQCAAPSRGPEATYYAASACAFESQATPAEALQTARRSNVAAHAATFASFDAFTYLYTPTDGDCDADAEYIVVFTARN